MSENRNSQRMRWASIGFVLLVILLLWWQVQRLATDLSLLDWADGAKAYENTLVMQQQSHKPILLFFYTDWCAGCKTLKQNILTDEVVIQQLKHYHLVKINPEAGLAENQLADQYGVGAYPTLVMLDSIRGKRLPIYRTSRVSTQQFIRQIQHTEKKLYL